MSSACIDCVQCLLISYLYLFMYICFAMIRLAWNARTPGKPARQAGTPQNARSPDQAKIDHHGTPWNATTKTITEIQKCGTPENARTPERTAGTPHSKCRPSCQGQAGGLSGLGRRIERTMHARPKIAETTNPLARWSKIRIEE